MAKVRILSGSEPATLIEKNITANGTYNASADNADGYSSVNVNVSPLLISKTITENGTYTAHSEPGAPDGYGTVTVNVPAGAQGVIVGTDDPISSQGSDGDYYYKRVPSLNPTVNGWDYRSSNSQSAGMRFSVSENTYIYGFQVYNRGAVTSGTINFGNVSISYTSGSITLNPGWTVHRLATPILLVLGVTYSLMVDYGSVGHIIYTPKSSLTSDTITITDGVYGTFPGTSDPTNVYGIDVMTGDSDILFVIDQYKKVNGVWTPITI